VYSEVFDLKPTECGDPLGQPAMPRLGAFVSPRSETLSYAPLRAAWLDARWLLSNLAMSLDFMPYRGFKPKWTELLERAGHAHNI
jgi:hypothetical protein